MVDALIHGIGFVQVWCMVDALVHGTSFVQVDAWLMHGSGLLVHVYNSISHNYSVHWFHHSTSTSGQLDGARTGGCNHLPVVAEKHWGL